MTRRMLINAQNREELRIAIVSDSVLQDFQVEVAERGLLRGNVYRGYINNIQPSLNAAFVNFGADRDGFLSMQDLVPEAWHRQPKEGKRPRIEEVLERNKPILVQVTRDGEGQKGAAVTTSVSLAGRYLVFTPFDDTRGVSRKVEDEELRAKLKEQTASLKIPDGGGFIVRTNAADQTKTTLTKDFTALSRLWKTIQTDFKKGQGASLLYNDQVIITRALRDYLDPTIEEVLIDDDAAFEQAEAYVKQFMPRGKVKLVRYAEREPLFTRFKVEEQIDRIHDRTVKLPSGGAIVIDRTEALIAIDVNSAKSTRASSQEENAYKVNVEAAREVARQLRLRDIGGLVVVDFIDMRNGKHRAGVEKTLREAMKDDKARFNVGRISPNGLLEINRQRLQQALHLRTHRPCPTCSGTGRIASPEAVGLGLLRKIEARAATSPVKGVRIALHPELADAFQNTRRRDIARLEEEFDIHIEVIASNKLHRPEQEIEWIPREGGHPQHKQQQQQHHHQHPQPHSPEREKPGQQNVAAHAAALPPAEGEGGGRKKKRRRKKKRGGDHATPVDATLTQTNGEDEHAFAPEQEDAFDDAQFAEQDDASDESEAEEHEGEGIEQEPSLEHGEAPQNGEGKRRRKRRRRRRGGGVAAAGGALDVTPTPEALSLVPELDEPPVSFWVHDESQAPTVEQPAPLARAADDEDDEPIVLDDNDPALDVPIEMPPDRWAGRKKRRRRRRGGRNGEAGAPEEQSSLTNDADSAAEESGEEEAAAPLQEELPLTVEPEEDEAAATEALEEEQPAEAAPRGRRRSRGGRGRRKSASETTPTQIEEVIVAAEEPAGAAAEVAEELAAKPKRPRKKSSAKKADGATPTPPAETPPEEVKPKRRGTRRKKSE